MARDLNYMPSNLLKPEIIEGRGQYRARFNDVISDWFDTKDEAIYHYWNLVAEKDAWAGFVARGHSLSE